MSILQPTSSTKVLSCKLWRWRRVASGVVCQILIAGTVHFPPVTRIKSLRRPNKSGLCPEVNSWLWLAQSSI